MSEQNGGSIMKGGKIILAVCAVVIVALLGTVIYLLVNRQEQEQQGNQPVSRNVVVNEDNVDEVLTQMQQQQQHRTAPGYYEVMMNTTWNFPSGEEPSSNAYVKNVETNTNSVYFDVTLADTEETILASPILPVGSYLDNITLDTALSAGTYDCIVTYHLLDDENISIATLKLTLKVVIEE